MIAEHLSVIRETWAAVEPIRDAAAQLIYERLTEIDPSTKALFATTDMAEQHDNLVRALSFVVEKADRFEDLKDALEALGRRHVGYGVRDRHYESVGAAPIWTLEQGLGDRFSPEARAAWTIAYALISGTMREAANQASSEAA